MVLKQRGKLGRGSISNQSTREFTETVETLSEDISSSQREKLLELEAILNQDRVCGCPYSSIDQFR